MAPQLAQLLQGLIAAGANLYGQMSGHTEDAEKIAAYIPLLANVNDAIERTTSTLKTAQGEGWADDPEDPRWAPIFEAADKRIQAALDAQP